ERGEAGDDAVEFFGGRAGAGGHGAETIGGEGEMAPEQGAIKLLFALEVVIEHGLVDAGAAGDAVDAGAGEPALGKFVGRSGEDAIGRDAGAAGHISTNQLVKYKPRIPVKHALGVQSLTSGSRA